MKGHIPGGFHYVVNKIMKRPKLVNSAFKKKKFEDSNLLRIREATRDCARAYGISAVVEFAGSDFYPTSEEKTNCLRSSGSHTDIFLEKFKQFLQRSIQSDKAFKYRSRMFLFYGPLMELFDFATHDCCGQAREVCYILQLPMYAQLNFRNYCAEVFVHLINLLGKWPLAFRRLLANNCSVNIKTC